MAWKPKLIKAQGLYCKATDIFVSTSDVILGFPRCKKCGVQMIMAGQFDMSDWIKN